MHESQYYVRGNTKILLMMQRFCIYAFMQLLRSSVKGLERQTVMKQNHRFSTVFSVFEIENFERLAYSSMIRKLKMYKNTSI